MAKQALNVKLERHKEKEGQNTFLLVMKRFHKQGNKKIGMKYWHIPHFSRAGIFLATGTVGIDIFQIIFGLDTSQNADDGPGTDEEDSVVLVSANHQIGIVILIHIEASAQRITKSGWRQARNIFCFQDLNHIYKERGENRKVRGKTNESLMLEPRESKWQKRVEKAAL